MRTWLITCSSSTLGVKLTEKLLKRGDRVAVTLQNACAFDGLKAQYGDHLWTATLDITDENAIQEVIDRAFSELGQIDVVINNAGYAPFCEVGELGEHQSLQQVAINIIGAVHIIRTALPKLRAQGYGRILHLSFTGIRHSTAIETDLTAEAENNLNINTVPTVPLIKSNLKLEAGSL